MGYWECCQSSLSCLLEDDFYECRLSFWEVGSLSWLVSKRPGGELQPTLTWFLGFIWFYKVLIIFKNLHELVDLAAELLGLLCSW